jgi:hypothetical protein
MKHSLFFILSQFILKIFFILKFFNLICSFALYGFQKCLKFAFLGSFFLPFFHFFYALLVFSQIELHSANFKAKPFWLLTFFFLTFIVRVFVVCLVSLFLNKLLCPLHVKSLCFLSAQECVFLPGLPFLTFCNV